MVAFIHILSGSATGFVWLHQYLMTLIRTAKVSWQITVYKPPKTSFGHPILSTTKSMRRTKVAISLHAYFFHSLFFSRSIPLRFSCGYRAKTTCSNSGGIMFIAVSYTDKYHSLNFFIVVPCILIISKFFSPKSSPFIKHIKC